MNSFDLAGYPCVGRVVGAVEAVWPEHDRFLRRRFDGAELSWAERIAEHVLLLAGDDLARFATDYRYMCDFLLEEELHFRRTGEYRLSSFEAARRLVYDDHEFMTRYMNGVLMSHLLWSNHAAVVEHLVRNFLPENAPGYRHLEIGPGHGLLLALAANDPRAGSVTGWDVSAASVEATRRALAVAAPGADVTLVERDLFAAGGADAFDSVVLSEVCEHLEDPVHALECVGRLLSASGRLFVNVPVNSPAPDHIYLLRTPEEATDMVGRAGYTILDARFFPATGMSLDRARRAGATISCAIVAQRR